MSSRVVSRYGSLTSSQRILRATTTSMMPLVRPGCGAAMSSHMVSLSPAIRLSTLSKVALHRDPRIYSPARLLSTATVSGATLSPSDSEHLAPSTSLTGNGRIGYLYFDSLFPIKLGFWDIRDWIVRTNHESLRERLKASIPPPETIGHDFNVIGAQARLKDGGAFLSFTYTPTQTSVPGSSLANLVDPALLQIEEAVKKGLKRGYAPNQALLLSWGRKPSVHVVKGKPWMEDLSRFPAHGVSVTLVGGDLSEEALWEILRPYGRIIMIEKKGTEAVVLFSRMRAATSARNCAHGIQVPGGPRLIINYRGADRAKAIWGWVTSHPRIVLPILAFLIGGLSYAIFDPLRGFFIESKLTRTFDPNNYRLYSWLKANTVDLLREGHDQGPSHDTIDWFERRAAKDDIQGWLRDKPETFITISGPKGSGKHKLLEEAIPKGAKVLRIDCAAIARNVGSSGSGSVGSGGDKAASDKEGKSNAEKLDTAIVSALASETGYWPVFGWLNSLNSMIDLASVGLIGSKAGFSKPTEEQLGQILEVTKRALENVKRKAEKKVDKQRREAKRSGSTSTPTVTREMSVQPAEASSDERTRQDLQLLTSSGTGEKYNLLGQEKGEDGPLATEARQKYSKLPTDKAPEKERPTAVPLPKEKGITVQAPIVIIDNFHLKSLRSPLLYSIIVDWSSQLVSSDLAHVIFVSDNPVAMYKEIGRALPDSRPANNVVLADAERSKAREFVRSRLREVREFSATGKAMQAASSEDRGISEDGDLSSSINGLFDRSNAASLSPPPSAAVPTVGEVLPEEDAEWVDKLGGRLTDLENLLQKVALGQTVPAAVSELITRTIIELRKSFFGDDSSDSPSTFSLPWSRSTAWSVIRLLASSEDGSVPYHWMLHSDAGAFKGDEGKLRAMEEAELISVRHKDGRPSLIRAGRPVLLEAMKELVNSDKTFRLTQELLDSKASLAKSEGIIRDLEKELLGLVELSKIGGRGVVARVDSLAKKLEAEQTKLGLTEKKVGNLQEELKQSE